jgi:glycine hydroxymethyltransferase
LPKPILEVISVYDKREGKMAYLKKYLQKMPEHEQKEGAIAFLASLDLIEKEYPLIAKKIIEELQDQRSFLKLIASENYSSLTVQLAMGNLLTDKYSEGYAGHRFYAGCENVDAIEQAAADQAKAIFGSDHAYVQPHSGADANLIAYWAILVQRVQNREIEKLGIKTINELTDEEHERIRELMLGQKMMGLSLNSGGHLTHGYRFNISSKIMRTYGYDVDPHSGMIDYAVLEKEVKKIQPLILVAGYSAYSRLINFAKMREIADTVGATLLVDMAHFAGLVAGKVMQGEYDPVPHAHIVTTTTHKTLRGPRGGMILCKEEFREVVDKGCPLVMGGPLPHVMAAKAIAFKEASKPDFQNYARQIVKNAQALAGALMREGVTILTGGTDNHLLVVDVEKSFHLTGLQAESILRKGGLTVNRNSIPFDKNNPWISSGIRVGTPALTTLGMKEQEMERIASLIIKLLRGAKPEISDGKPSKRTALVDPKILEQIRGEAKELLKAFPLYPELVID